MSLVDEEQGGEHSPETQRLLTTATDFIAFPAVPTGVAASMEQLAAAAAAPWLSSQ